MKPVICARALDTFDLRRNLYLPRNSYSPCFRAADFSHRVRFCSRMPHRRRAVKNTLFVPAIVILALVSAAVPIFAHHSWPLSFSQLVTVKGTVTEFVWANPHPLISLEVRTSDGAVEKWLG